LVIHRLWSRTGMKMWNWLAWLITFNFINIAWIFFRAKEWDDAIKVFSSMFDFNLGMELNLLQLFWISSTLLLVLFFKNSHEIIAKGYTKNFILFTSTFLFILTLLQLTNIIIQDDKISEFLYFNF